VSRLNSHGNGINIRKKVLGGLVAMPYNHFYCSRCCEGKRGQRLWKKKITYTEGLTYNVAVATAVNMAQ
jgi:hypothetical protein